MHSYPITVILILLIPSTFAWAQPDSELPCGEPITLEYIYKKDELKIPPVNPGLPRGFKWSEEGHILAYFVSDTTEAASLVIYDPQKNSQEFLLTPTALHEAIIALASEPEGVDIPPSTQPQTIPASATNYTEIKRFEWTGGDHTLRLHTEKQKYIWHWAENRLTADQEEEKKLPDGEREEILYSPNERYAAFLRNNNLYIYDTEQNKEIQMTVDGSETLLNGKFSWVYWEEFHYRRTWGAFYWSPNNDAIAYLQTDEKDVAEFPIMDYSKQVPEMRIMRYPKAGTKNPEVRLGIVSLSTRETRWIDLGAPFEYITHVRWHPSGDFLAVQTLNREQNHLTLHFANPRDGSSRIILEEKDDEWVESYVGPYFLENSEEFLWFSDRSGYRHIYKYSQDGKECMSLTQGEWEVNPRLWEQDLTLDEEDKKVFFTANESSPLEQQLYSVSLSGGKIQRITHEPGWHTVHLSANRKFSVDSYQNTSTPRRIDLLNEHGQTVQILGKTTTEDYAPYRIHPAETIEIRDENGLTYYASLLKPCDFQPDRKYPVIVTVYGGPVGQVVRNVFTDVDEIAFVNRGFLHFKFDNRGTPGRGHIWLQAVYENFAEIPLKDLEIGVNYLRSLPYVDDENIGIWGWSHGGYLTCAAMTIAPDLFKAGAAVAPPTDWKLYDTIYTERYMGLPEKNEEGYMASSPVEHAEQLKGNLFLAHGVRDDNVHAQNVYQLIQELVRNEKDYELHLYPQGDHGIGGDTERYFLFDRILKFFEKHLK